MQKNNRQSNCPIVAVINMKGGVGKTTLTANVFREIFRRHSKRILLIDLDPQFNLSQTLYKRTTYEAIRKAKKTIWHVMEPESPTTVFHVSDESHTEIGPVDDYTQRIRLLNGTENTDLRLLAGDFRLSLINLREGASLRTPRTRFRSYIDHARDAYDLIVLDCNPSSSFLTRIALEAATNLVVPVRPDRYSVLGVEMLTDYVKQMPTIARMPETAIVINGAERNAASDAVILGLRTHPIYGPQTLTAQIPNSAVLTARQDYTGFAVDRKVSYSQTVRKHLAAVADELALKLGVI